MNTLCVAVFVALVAVAHGSGIGLGLGGLGSAAVIAGPAGTVTTGGLGGAIIGPAGIAGAGILGHGIGAPLVTSQAAAQLALQLSVPAGSGLEGQWIPDVNEKLYDDGSYKPHLW
ncbi:isoniazid-induced protein IniB-like [Zophobas morio]|uniref:Antidiuretic factor b-3 n=1 Tax=Zophobas atratus TaxID=7074 RepID=A0A977SQS4_ZOPAT|nr:antidiuretic factor b-3 [Zophobas atratus]